MRTDLTLLAVDPNLSTAIQGVILIGVVMFGSLIAIRGHAMTMSLAPRGASIAVRLASLRRQLFRDRPNGPAPRSCSSILLRRPELPAPASSAPTGSES